MHPMDVLRSRLANINTLGRAEEHDLRQARASIDVVGCFIDEMLQLDHADKAQEMLLELPRIIREHCMLKPAYADHGLDPLAVMIRFLDDERLDARWRHRQLRNAVERLDSVRKSLTPAEMPAYPDDTHIMKSSKDGRTVVVRRIDPATGKPGRVDNPIGPACVEPGGERYALDGEFMSREEWERRRHRDADTSSSCGCK